MTRVAICSAASSPFMDSPNELAISKQTAPVVSDDALQGVLPPARPIIAIDWDDTLLSTSWLSTWVPDVLFPGEVPVPVLRALERLEGSVLRLLKSATELSDVYIVTNSEQNWVELTAARYFPQVSEFIKSSNITVISARTTFEKEFPSSPMYWKKMVFAQILESVPGQVNLTSIGDGMAERVAARSVGEMFGDRDCFVKTVKFMDRPLNAQLRGEIDRVSSELEALVNFQGDMDIVLAVQMPESSDFSKPLQVRMSIQEKDSRSETSPMSIEV